MVSYVYQIKATRKASIDTKKKGKKKKKKRKEEKKLC